MSDSHLYDWSKRKPTTTDPSIKRRLCPGGHNQVLLNGEDVSYLRIIRFQTGDDGWVEYWMLGDDGKHLLDDDGEPIIGNRLHGTVEYHDLRESEDPWKCINRTTLPNNNKRKRGRDAK